MNPAERIIYRDILAKLEKSPALKEAIKSRACGKSWTPIIYPPDADTTVLISNRAWDEPVWLGFLDADGWRFVDAGLCVPQPEAWMHLPEPVGTSQT